MIRSAPEPARTIVGTFLVLAAIALAVAPLSVALRSSGVALLAYFAFSVGGMPFAYLTALVAPALGLLGGDQAWMIMLPVILSGNLLAMLGLEFGWRWGALLLSPLLLVTPAFVVMTLSAQSLFRVDLPWDDAGGAWLALHLLMALFGMLIALMIDRQRRRGEASSLAPAAGGSAAGAGAPGTPSR